MRETKDLTKGNESKVILQFALPMIIGNLLQQLYNVTDSIIVGRFIGADALAAVGSSFTMMVFLTSIILGLCMGSSVVFSMLFGADKTDELKSSLFTSFCFIGLITIIISIVSITFINEILYLFRIPAEILADTKSYLKIIFYGIAFTSIYNYFAAVMRSMGNSLIPFLFLIVSAVINIVLDIIFVVPLGMGVNGAAYATIIAQGFSAFGLAIFCIIKVPQIHLQRKHMRFNKSIFKLIVNHSVLTSIQQSVMNFGILMIQGLVNSFGVNTIAAFAAAVKIDSFAYMPVQDLGNAFSTYVAQNMGSGKMDRIKKGIRATVKIITIYCIAITSLVLLFAEPLMRIFIKSNEVEILLIGKQYLFIEGSFYCLIGYLFMYYGLFRGIGRPSVSILLTVVSLGTRVILAYSLSAIPSIGLAGIWWAIPIGWALADIIGFYNARKSINVNT